MKWTIAPCIALLLYALLFFSGVLLSLPLMTSAWLTSGWVVFGMVVLRYSPIKISKPFENEGLKSHASDLLLSSSGITILFSSFSIAIFLVFFFLHAFSYFTNNQQIPLSPYSIHSLISFWTCGIIFSLSDIFSRNTFIGAQSLYHKLHFSPEYEKSSLSLIRNKIFPDISLLEDGRALDIGKIKVFDSVYGLPDFYIREIKHLAEDATDDFIRQRAKKALETLKKLEILSTPSFEVFKTDNFLQDDLSVSLADQLLHFATQFQSKIITAEPTQYKNEDDPSPHVIAIDAITAFAKNNIPKGEYLSIKIQRPGKEPKQGIGYLEDSSMVVVNGGGDYLGKTIKVQFLSQKYSSSGRIFFCNAVPLSEEESSSSTINTSHAYRQTSQQSYPSINSNEFLQQ